MLRLLGGADCQQEAERSLHDALCVVRCLVHRRALIPGGAAPEVELSLQLGRAAKTLQVGSSAHGASLGESRVHVMCMVEGMAGAVWRHRPVHTYECGTCGASC